MTNRIAYYRVSTGDQSIEAQRQALGGGFDQEFSDEGVSGATLAASRPGFAKLLDRIRPKDTLHVYAVDRLGRDALDVQGTVRALLDKGVTVDIHGLGSIGRGVGELILAVLAQVADMERNRIKERCETGREAARASLAATGKTHKGKAGLGRQPVPIGDQIAPYRASTGASIAQTAAHFGISTATVKRYTAAAAKVEKLAQDHATRSNARNEREWDKIERDEAAIVRMTARVEGLRKLAHGDE